MSFPPRRSASSSSSSSSSSSCSSSASSTGSNKLVSKNVFLWIGIKGDEALKSDANFDVRDPRDLPKPAAYVAMIHLPGIPRTERVWYHCLGTEWDENDRNGGMDDHYHHVVNDDRWSSNRYCERVIPCATFPVEKFDLFEKCFYATPPQNHGHFMIRFLRKLVQAEVVQPYTIRLIVDVIKEFERSPVLDPKLDGELPDPKPLSVLDEHEEQMMFAMEL